MHIRRILAVSLILLAAACDLEPLDPGEEEPGELLIFGADTRVLSTTPQRLETIATVVNAGEDAVLVRFGLCPTQDIVLRAYRTQARTGAPVWNSRVAFASRQCETGSVERTLATGESRVFVLPVTAQEILGDSLSAGQFFFTTTLRLLEPDVQTSELPSGAAVLTQ